MNKHLVRIVCWKYGHVNDLALTPKQADKLPAQTAKGTRVCPTCTCEGLGNNSFAIIVSPGVVGDQNLSKAYRCEHGHATVVRGFTGGMLNTRFGCGHDDFVNVEGTVEEVQELVDDLEIFCHHIVGEDSICGASLSPIDDVILENPKGRNFKTKTRVGDIWDKGGMEPVKTGSYDRDGYFHQSKTDIANRERLKRLKNRRLVSEERSPGTPISRPINRPVRRRSKESIDDLRTS